MRFTRVHSIFRLAVLASGFALGLYGTTISATRTQNELTARIPFAFHAGTERMPAGVYSISVLSDHEVLFRDRDRGQEINTSLVVIPSEEAEFQRDGRLVFRRYGEQVFLHGVWPAASSDGVSLVPTLEERAVRSHSEQPESKAQITINAEPNL
jgi:hypothetical protein